jgi:hypothetical protein
MSKVMLHCQAESVQLNCPGGDNVTLDCALRPGHTGFHRAQREEYGTKTRRTPEGKYVRDPRSKYVYTVEWFEQSVEVVK